MVGVESNGFLLTKLNRAVVNFCAGLFLNFFQTMKGLRFKNYPISLYGIQLLPMSDLPYRSDSILVGFILQYCD